MTFIFIFLPATRVKFVIKLALATKKNPVGLAIGNGIHLIDATYNSTG